MDLSADELAEARATIARALDEDLRYGPDVTTLATVPADATTTASMVTREPGVIAGVDIALLVLDEVLGADGYRVKRPRRRRRPAGGRRRAADRRGAHAGTADRRTDHAEPGVPPVGIATATAAWVAAVEGTGAQIRDTRKTLPGLRALQKYAVRVGGGVNHRMGLGDAALIKDNHVAAAGSVVAALRAVRAAAPDLPCEVEVDSLEQLDEVLAENLADEALVLLDNFPVWQTQIAVQRRDSRSPATKLESSGGLSLDTAAEYAGTGVDYLAVGALTHSVRVSTSGWISKATGTRKSAHSVADRLAVTRALVNVESRRLCRADHHQSGRGGRPRSVWPAGRFTGRTMLKADYSSEPERGCQEAKACAAVDVVRRGVSLNTNLMPAGGPADITGALRPSRPTPGYRSTTAGSICWRGWIRRPRSPLPVRSANSPTT